MVEYRRYIVYNVIKNDKSFMRISYMVEFQHCNLIIEFLEKKKRKILLMKQIFSQKK